MKLQAEGHKRIWNHYTIALIRLQNCRIEKAKNCQQCMQILNSQYFVDMQSHVGAKMNNINIHNPYYL